MLTSEVRNEISRRARAVVKGQRWAYRLGKQRGALGSLVIAITAAGVGLVIGAILGTEAGSGSERREVPAASSEAAPLKEQTKNETLDDSDAVDAIENLKAEAVVEPVAEDIAQKIAPDFDALHEVHYPATEILIEDENGDAVSAGPSYPITDEDLQEPEETPAAESQTPTKAPEFEDVRATPAETEPDPEVETTSEPELETVIEAVVETGDPLWQRHAVPPPGLNGEPVIALVIDDLGLNRVNSRRAIDLPAPLTLSFLTYAEGLEGMTSNARDAGHELLVHVPMEPRDLRWDPGPNALLVGLPEEELERRLEWALGRFDGYVGINNHMGSRFTTSLLGMAQVMATLKDRELLFLDSLTAGSSVGITLAERLDVPHVGRDIFIDNTPDDVESIWIQLKKLERVAQRRGEAIGIAHPHSETLAVLAEWIPSVTKRGFALVPLSTVVERAMAGAQISKTPE